jgi:hypothetical protein
VYCFLLFLPATECSGAGCVPPSSVTRPTVACVHMVPGTAHCANLTVPSGAYCRTTGRWIKLLNTVVCKHPSVRCRLQHTLKSCMLCSPPLPCFPRDPNNVKLYPGLRYLLLHHVFCAFIYPRLLLKLILPSFRWCMTTLWNMVLTLLHYGIITFRKACAPV